MHTAAAAERSRRKRLVSVPARDHVESLPAASARPLSPQKSLASSPPLGVTSARTEQSRILSAARLSSHPGDAHEDGISKSTRSSRLIAPGSPPGPPAACPFPRYKQ